MEVSLQRAGRRAKAAWRRRTRRLVSFTLADYRAIDPRSPHLNIPVCQPGGIFKEAFMAAVSNFALRLPQSLMDDVKRMAKQNTVSVNQFLVQAAWMAGLPRMVIQSAG